MLAMNINKALSKFLDFATVTGSINPGVDERPLTSTVRRSKMVSVASKPAFSNQVFARGVKVNSADTSVLGAPSRIIPVSLRPPSTSCNAL